MLQINEYFYRLQGKDLFVHKNHSHNEIEFIQVINGNGVVVKNDKTFLLQSQHIYVIDARNTHIVYPKPEDCTYYIRNKIVINADSFMKYYKDLGMGDILEKLFDTAPISTVLNPKIDKIYETVSALCSSQKEENIAFAHGYITELMHWIYLNAETALYDKHRDTFQKMLDIINEKEGMTSLGEISKILYMDKHYLCHLFKQKTGTTLSAYLADKIFEKSCKLLENTSYSVEEVAYMCGFSSASSLTRFFKSKYGMTPSKYRSERKAALKCFFI